MNLLLGSFSDFCCHSSNRSRLSRAESQNRSNNAGQEATCQEATCRVACRGLRETEQCSWKRMLCYNACVYTVFVCLSVCLFVCPCARATRIPTSIGTRILYTAAMLAGRPRPRQVLLGQSCAPSSCPSCPGHMSLASFSGQRSGQCAGHSAASLDAANARKVQGCSES